MKNFGHGHTTKVLITGVSGFIGSEIAQQLADTGYSVGGYLRYSPRVAQNIKPVLGRIELFFVDLRDMSTISWTLRAFQPDIVIHLAAITPVSYSFEHPQEVSEVNYVGTINVAEACRREVPNLKKFIFASTMEVYGRAGEVAFDEGVSPNPTSPYAVAKFAAEKYLLCMHQIYNFPAVIIRNSNVFGRKNDTYFITETVIKQMLESNVINLGNSKPVRSYIYIQDLTSIYQKIIEAPVDLVAGQVFNTGPDNGLSVENLVSTIAEVMGWKGKINWNTRDIRAGEILYLNTTDKKLRKTLNWKPEFGLKQGLHEIADYYKSKTDS